MAFVDLRRQPGDEPRVGWQEDGSLLATATLRRVDSDTVEVVELDGVETDALIQSIAARVTATRLVVDGRTIAIDAESPSDERATTLSALEDAIAASWSAETAESAEWWEPDNPARDQCAVTALVVRDLFGGEILVANVLHDGRRVERHAWNRLASGLEIDLTRRQFVRGEQLGPAEAADPDELARRHAAAYALLGDRVRQQLSD